MLCLLIGLLRGVPAAAEAWQRDPVLSRLLVKQMVTDAAGYRWIVASEGVFRYDGYELVPLAQLVRHGCAVPPHLKAWLLVLDPAGRLWLGTEQGLFCFTLRTGLLQAVPLPQSVQAVKPDVVALLLHPRSGQLWVASETAVIVLDPNHPTRPLGPPRAVGGIPYYFQPDGSPAGVWLSFRQPNWPVPRVYTDALPPGAVQLAPTGPPLRRLTATCFVVPVPGTEPLQIFSASALFVLQDGQLREVRRWLPAGNEDNFMPRTTQPDSLREWVSQGCRMQLVRRGRQVGAVEVDTLQLGTSLADHRHSYVLEQDPVGIQWCYSQFWRGCYKQPVAHRRVVQPMALANGRPTPSSRAIVRLPDGRLLLGAYGGPLVQAADSPNGPLRPLAVTQNGVARLPLGYDLLVSRRKEIFFCEDLLGFSQLNPRTGELHTLPFVADEVHPPIHCAALLEDRAGRLWGGTSNGLFQLLPQQGRVLRYTTGQGARRLAELDILDMAEDAPSGALWLATSRGLYLLSPSTGALRRIGGQNQAGRSLPTDALLCVASAGAGRAWVGTSDAGLLLVDGRAGLVQQIDMAAGLPSHIVATVIGRPDGTVWAGTFAGLVHYDPARQRLAVLTEADGLTDAEMNRNSAYADPLTGALWFGGVGGLHRVWPTATEAESRHAPARLLVTATARPNPKATGDSTLAVQWLTGAQLPQLQLAAGPAAFVELRLALTNLLLPDLTHYTYRLWRTGETTPSPWLPTTRRLVLRSLPAGDYVVEVRAETVTGQPAANTLRLPLHAARVWWQHPLTWVLAAVALVLLGYFLFWLQGRRARREARLREELAANLHDEVGTLLTKINLMAEVLHRPPNPLAPPNTTDPAAATITARLLRNTRAAVEAMRDVVWSIDSRADSVEALLDRMRDYLDQTTQSAGLTGQFETDSLTRLEPLQPVVRKQVYLIFKEALTNVIRHGKGVTTVGVKLRRQQKGFLLEVTDDGQPLTTPVRRSGLGLRNMTARAQALGGKLSAGPRDDGSPGFCVRLTI